MKRLLHGLFGLTLLLTTTVFAQVNSSSFRDSYIKNIIIQIPNDLNPLLDLLKKKGFQIKFESPPRRGVYGLFQWKSKTLWISPISFEMGIGRQIILHEATHAAQSCPYGSFSPIGWKLPISQSIRNEVQANLLRNYVTSQYSIEEEAFYLQSQKNGVELLIEAINVRCR